MKVFLYLIMVFIYFSTTSLTIAQPFIRTAGSPNPFAIDNFFDFNVYSGASWVDINGDDYLDLFIMPNTVYKNNGDGTFMQDSTGIGLNFNAFNGTIGGASWADVDNDGDTDCFLAAGNSFNPNNANQNVLYYNDGTGKFVPSNAPVFTNATRYGWACSWGDFDNNNFVDLIVAYPNGFFTTAVAPATPSLFYLNEDGTQFRQDTTYGFTKGFAPYTVPFWADFDDDGDQDLFIASGPGGLPGLDSIYENQLSETGQATLIASQQSFALENQDGQVYNFIDFDNDRDLDLCLTNYAGAPNKFYVNTDGNYTSTNTSFTYNSTSLANAWGDFDNDGDLDAMFSNDINGLAELHINNGDGSFSLSTVELCNHYQVSGITLGDYDNDGDLDAFFSGFAKGLALYTNFLDNGNHWVNLRLEGSPSNRSAIGAQVHIKATINGQEVWQRRAVSAQNTFQGQNSLRVHFGLADATSIDSMVIHWPSGNEESFASITPDKFYHVLEGTGIMDLTTDTDDPKIVEDINIFPNPTSELLNVRYQMANPEAIQFSIYSADGRLLQSKNEKPNRELNEINFPVQNLPVGAYLLTLRSKKGILSKAFIIRR